MRNNKVALHFGAVVRCVDGECGELRRVIVDSSTMATTHLVVEPRNGRHRGTLVPIALVDAFTPRDVRLGCTLASFDALDDAQDTEVRPEARFDWEDQRAQASPIGFLGHLGPRVLDADGLGTGRTPTIPTARTAAQIPDAEGEVWRGQPAHASDGPIGHALGVVLGPRARVTHVLLGEGHLRGKKEVAVPVGAVRFVVDDGVYLDLTRRQVGELPPAEPARTPGVPSA